MRRKVDPAKLERILSLREERGLSYRRIAEIVGVSEQVVGYHCLMQAADKPDAGPIVLVRRHNTIRSRAFTDVEDRQLIDMAMRGLRQSEMARHLGRPPNSIKARLAILARHQERGVVASTRQLPGRRPTAIPFTQKEPA